MKKATTTLFLLAGGLDGSCAYQNDQSAVAPTLNVWPQPSQMAKPLSVPSWEIDHLALDYSGTSALVTDAFSRFEKAVGAPKKVLGKNKMYVVVTVADSSGSEALGLHTDESYSLQVAQPNATISAPTVFGAMHALETLAQIVEPKAAQTMGAKSATLNWEVSINDAPRFAHRGIMLDTSRNFMELGALRRTLDAMAMNKLNVLHWHVSDAQSFPFESKSYPELAAHGAYDQDRVYDAAAVKALLAYARARGVRVIPEFDMPGHAWQGFAGWAQEHNEREITVCGGHEPWGEMCAEPPCGQLDPTNNFTYTVVEALWKDVAAAFGDEQFVHVGGDEVNAACWNSSASIRAWMTANGLPPTDGDSFTSLWGIFQDRLDAIITAPVATGGLGKTMIKWDDSFLAGQAGSKDTVIQVWHGMDTLTKVVQAGHRAVLSNYDKLYLDCGTGNWITGGASWCAPYKSWQDVWGNEPLSDASLTKDQAALVLGGEVALWGESIDATNIDQKAWPRGCAHAERMWSPSAAELKVTWTNATHRLLAHRERMVARGISVNQIMPRYCLQNPGGCPAP